jgi:hypothetical protein
MLSFPFSDRPLRFPDVTRVMSACGGRFPQAVEATRQPIQSWTTIRAAASSELASLAGSKRDNRCSMLGCQLCQRLAPKKAHRGHLRRF